MAIKRARKQRVFADFTVENHGSIFLLRPNTPAGRIWIEDHVNVNDETQFFGGALVVEPRYIGDLVTGIVNDGYGVN